MFNQLAQGLRNIWRFIRNLTPTDVLPWTIWNVVVWLTDQLAYALGGGTAGKQVTANVVIAIIGLWSFGWFIPLFPLFGVSILVGLLRFIPAVNQYWTRHWVFQQTR